MKRRAHCSGTPYECVRVLSLARVFTQLRSHFGASVLPPVGASSVGAQMPPACTEPVGAGESDEIAARKLSWQGEALVEDVALWLEQRATSGRPKNLGALLGRTHRLPIGELVLLLLHLKGTFTGSDSNQSVWCSRRRGQKHVLEFLKNWRTEIAGDIEILEHSKTGCAVHASAMPATICWALEIAAESFSDSHWDRVLRRVIPKCVQASALTKLKGRHRPARNVMTPCLTPAKAQTALEDAFEERLREFRATHQTFTREQLEVMIVERDDTIRELRKETSSLWRSRQAWIAKHGKLKIKNKTQATEYSELEVDGPADTSFFIVYRCFK